MAAAALSLGYDRCRVGLLRPEAAAVMAELRRSPAGRPMGTVALTEGNRLDRRLVLRSDSEGEFSEGREEPLRWIGIKAEFVVVAAETSHVR
jgi:hypothetical protein